MFICFFFLFFFKSLSLSLSLSHCTLLVFVVVVFLAGQVQSQLHFLPLGQTSLLFLLATAALAARVDRVRWCFRVRLFEERRFGFRGNLFDVTV